MAREVYDFPVTVPAGTLQTAPQVSALAMPPREVNEIEVIVPPGPRGEVGFALGAAGNAVLPSKRGQWIVTDGEKVVWPLEAQITSGAWQLLAYNTGAYPHTLHVRFQVSLPGTSAAAPISPLPPGQLGSPADGAPVLVFPPLPELPPFPPPDIPPPPELPPLPPLGSIGASPIPPPPDIVLPSGEVIRAKDLPDDVIVWFYQVSHLLAYGDFGRPQDQQAYLTAIRTGQIGVNDQFASWWQDGNAQGRAYKKAAGQ